MSQTCADARREGYRRAIRDLGLPEVSAIGKLRREAGYELTLRLLAEEPKVDALFAGCDLMAAMVAPVPARTSIA